MNSVVLCGRLGDDPKLSGEGSRARLNIRLATSEYRKGEDGKWEEYTDWHTCVMWGKRAESLANRVRRGALVSVNGKLRTRKYERDGQTQYMTEVVLDQCEVMQSNRFGSE